MACCRPVHAQGSREPNAAARDYGLSAVRRGPGREVRGSTSLRREPRARRVGARSACAFYESHALRAWMLVFACGCSSSSRWQPRARPVLPPLGRSSLRRGLLAARWLLRPPRPVPNLLSLPEHFRWSVQNSNSNATRRGPNTRASQLTWLCPLLVTGTHDGTFSLRMACAYRSR